MSRVPVTELPDAGLAQLLRTEDDPVRKRAAQAEALRRLPVRQLVGGGYMVASRTTKGAWWWVDLTRLLLTTTQPRACTCPADTPRCWHVRQVLAYTRLQDALNTRPTPPPNVAGLVD